MPTNSIAPQQGKSVGNVSTGGSWNQQSWQPYPWPQPWPQPKVYPSTNIFTTVVSCDDYANEIEVDRGEHDAVLRFYRGRSGKSRTLVKEITVPVGLLDWLSERE